MTVILRQAMAVDRRNGEDPYLDEEQAGEDGDGEIDEVCIPMEDRHKKLSRSSDSFIFKVPRQLRQVNPSAYEPRIISIGPYHRDKDHLNETENQKWDSLKTLLERRNEDSPVRYAEAMRELEHAARHCYVESLNLMSSEEFVQMLVLDGCFIVEQIRRLRNVFKLNFNQVIVGQELLLVENQLPFFVLEELFHMTKTPNDEDVTFAEMALRFFSQIVPGPGIRELNSRRSIGRKTNEIKIKHLLGLVQDNWLPSHRVKPYAGDRKWNRICSASELLEQGIKFKKHTGLDVSLFDIKFKKGRFEIPTLTINYDTERIFRNLIACEQFNEGTTYVMDYAIFMDSLINKADDVALLSKYGIIVHLLGRDEEVADMFNKLNAGVYLKADFYYTEIFNEVNKHCRRRWTRWKVNLRNKYFNTPWGWVLISIIAGGILLLLTMVQTVYAVLSYHKRGG